MKKLLIAAVAALSLAGCAELQKLEAGLSLANASITNPVTKEKEAEIELAVDSAIKLLIAYKQACIQGTADVHCKANIAMIQPYTRAIKPLMAQLRTFVDGSDQINAIVVYNQLVALYGNMKQAAATAGIAVGG